jgi:hypothetical protein
VVADIKSGILYNGCTRMDHCYGIMKTYRNIVDSENFRMCVVFQHS